MVAVVDSGWDRRIADPRLLPGAATLAAGSPDPDDHDRLGHGTTCAAELLHWAPQARILPVRIFGADSDTTPEALARAIEWAAGRGVAVINLSVGSRRASDRPVIAAAVAAARSAGAVLVAAGPNAGPPTVPADLAGVIGVWPSLDCAPGEFRRRAGDGLAIDAWAGPRQVPLAGTHRPGDGTSLAAAEVSGRIAALLAAGTPADPAVLVHRLVSLALV